MDYYVVKCVGLIGTWGHVEPAGRWLCGYNPDLVDETGEYQGLSSWTSNRAKAIRFATREQAQECIDAVPGDNPRKPDGMPNQPLGRFRLVIELITPEPPKPKFDLLEEMRLDGTLTR